MFQTATGWLGWSPNVVLNANIEHLRLAIAGKVDFVKKTNPWGNGEDTEAPPQSSPELVVRQVQDMVAQLQHNQRQKGKKRK